MTELERYVLEEHVEDYLDGIISRRELLRRVALVVGSTSAAGAFIASAGCGPGTAHSGAPTAAPRSIAPPSPYATPPAQATTDGVTVRSDDSRIKVDQVIMKAADGTALMSYLACPGHGQGRVPAVLVIHENQGMKEHIRDVVRRVATAGYAGLDRFTRASTTPSTTTPAPDTCPHKRSRRG